MRDWQGRISIKADVCHGVACISGTRIPVSVILDNLAEGLAPEQIVTSYPSLTVDDIRAAMAYGAELAREQLVELPRRAS